ADDIGGAHLTYDKRKTLMEMVIANADGPAPIPKYKTARENLEHVVYDAGGVFGGHGGLAHPHGSQAHSGELAKVPTPHHRYWPAVQNYENPFTPERRAALSKSMVPVIAFSSTNIAPDWPEKVEKSAHETGAPANDVSFTKLDGTGHLDVLCGTESEAKVFAP